MSLWDRPTKKKVGPLESLWSIFFEVWLGGEAGGNALGLLDPEPVLDALVRLECSVKKKGGDARVWLRVLRAPVRL